MCGVNKNFDCFFKRSDQPGKYRSHCKDCTSISIRIKYEKYHIPVPPQQSKIKINPTRTKEDAVKIRNLWRRVKYRKLPKGKRALKIKSNKLLSENGKRIIKAEYAKRYRDKYPDRIMLTRKISIPRRRELIKMNHDEISDSYVRMILCGNNSGLTAKDIPQDLIELKRAEIQIQRELAK